MDFTKPGTTSWVNVNLTKDPTIMIIRWGNVNSLFPDASDDTLTAVYLLNLLLGDDGSVIFCLSHTESKTRSMRYWEHECCVSGFSQFHRFKKQCDAFVADSCKGRLHHLCSVPFSSFYHILYMFNVLTKHHVAMPAKLKDASCDL